MHVPFWLFNSKISAQAEFRAEKVRVIYTPKETVTQISIYNCRRAGTMSFEKIPVDGSKRMDDTYMTVSSRSIIRSLCRSARLISRAILPTNTT